MNIEAVRAAIAKLGTGEYQDGSSTIPGTTYQPIGDWFPELADIPCHKPEAVRDDFWAVVRDYAQHDKWWSTSVIDMGAANGYYALGLKRLGVVNAVCVERDPASRDVLKALGLTATPEPLRGHFLHDVALVMNLHMWWTKQGIADERMRWVAENASTTYFQTAGRHSHGMYTLDELGGAVDEETYLSRYFESVTFVRTTQKHGGVRHLWRCES